MVSHQRERTYADMCLRGPDADLSLSVEAARVVASGSCALSAVMRLQPGRRAYQRARDRRQLHNRALLGQDGQYPGDVGGMLGVAQGCVAEQGRIPANRALQLRMVLPRLRSIWSRNALITGACRSAISSRHGEVRCAGRRSRVAAIAYRGRGL